MAITPYEYFYDGQQRRFLEQIVRAFSGFQYKTGASGSNPAHLVMVPVMMAPTSQIAANIIANGSENAINAVPMITIYQTGLSGRIADLQNPAHIDHRQVYEREIIDGKYGEKLGNVYSVDRIMPLPFIMTIQVDIWTSNMDQKMQLIEQILVAMYPQFEIQNSENGLDWTAVSICFLEDEMDFTSRTIPIGTASSNDVLDIFTIRLRIPFYLTAPAKVKKLVRIEQVIANVGELIADQKGFADMGTVYDTVIVTPHDAFISVDGNAVTLLNNHGGEFLSNGALPSWKELFDLYGPFRPAQSELRLLLTTNLDGPFISGTMQFGTEINKLVWTIDADTLPANTMQPVDAVIDPLTSYPGQVLPAATNGTRYLLVNDVGHSVIWGNLTASTNDVIQYDGAQWTVVFDASVNTLDQFVLNSHTGRQLVWDGDQWVMSVDNVYSPGYWRIRL